SGASARRGSHHPAAWMIVLPEAEQRPSHQPVRAGAGVQEKSKGGSTRSSWPPRSRKMCSTRTRDKSSNFGSGYTSERNGLARSSASLPPPPRPRPANGPPPPPPLPAVYVVQLQKHPQHLLDLPEPDSVFHEDHVHLRGPQHRVGVLPAAGREQPAVRRADER